MITASQIDTSNVTGEQIGRCWKAFKGSVGFYRVESESDPTLDYSVEYVKGKGFTCTCKAGQTGFSNCKAGYCKHVAWAVACEKEVRAAIAELEVKQAQKVEVKVVEVKKLAPMAAKEKRDDYNLNGGRMYGLSLIAEMKKLASETFSH